MAARTDRFAGGRAGASNPLAVALGAFVPGRWDVVEVSIEVCDGTPQDVEKDVAGWVAAVGTFCPWASYVQRRM